ncbi:hypothetical protein INR49_024107 [Caranx melampygus]|nr:hypothetical protein INR49_024107 [Caranx melampygus]
MSWLQTPQACQMSGYEGKGYEQVEKELRQSSHPAKRRREGVKNSEELGIHLLVLSLSDRRNQDAKDDKMP